jgi:hypothetical protein
MVQLTDRTLDPGADASNLRWGEPYTETTETM